MKRHDKQTYFLFGAVAITLGGYLLYELLAQAYLQVFGRSIDGMLLVGLSASMWASNGIAARQRNLEASLTRRVDEKLAEIESRLRHRENKLSWLEHSDTQIRNDTSALRRWLQAQGSGIRELKQKHNRSLPPALGTVEEAFREIATGVAE